jgi:hypothetical protein
MHKRQRRSGPQNLRMRPYATSVCGVKLLVYEDLYEAVC